MPTIVCSDYSAVTASPSPPRAKARRPSAVPTQTQTRQSQRVSLANSIARDPVVYDPTPADSVYVLSPYTSDHQSLTWQTVS